MMKKLKKIINLFLIIGIIFSSFIPINIYANEVKIGTVTGNTVRFRKKATTGSSIIREFNAGARLLIIGSIAAGNGCNKVWYQAEYNGTIGYICSEYVKISEIPTNNLNLSFEEQVLAFPESYRSSLIELNKKYPTWNFLPLETNLNFEKVVASQSIVGKSLIQGSEGYRSTSGGSYNYLTDKFKVLEGSNWYAANDEAVAYYLDPRNFLNETNIFMFEDLTFYPNFQSKAVVEGVLSSDFLKQYSNIFMDAASSYNVSPLHLAARVRQEVGSNGSTATSGCNFTYEGKSYSGLYNFFNIGASTSSNPVLKGLVYANGGQDGSLTSYGRPWTTPEKSILGGANFISSGYINKGQFTSYLQKFNVNPGSSYTLHTHQYMTNIKAPYSESASTSRGYVSLSLENEPFVFTIPVYKNMPSKTSLPSSGNPNNYLKYLHLNNKSIADFDNDKSDYTIYLSSINNKVELTGEPVNSKAQIDGLGEITIDKAEINHQIKITAENGALKTFNLNFKVVSDLPITVEDIVSNMGIKYDDTYLRGIGLGTDMETISNKVKGVHALAQTTVKDLNGKLKEKGTFSTGDKVIIESGLDTKTYTVIIKGDTNGDGKIDLVDLLRVRKHLLGSKLENEYYQAADINGDGKIDLIDLLLVQKHLLKDKIIV